MLTLALNFKEKPNVMQSDIINSSGAVISIISLIV